MAKRVDPDADTKRAAMLAFMASHDLNVYRWTKLAGLNESTLRNFLKGTSSSLTYDTALKLANAVGATVTEILGGPPDATTNVQKTAVLKSYRAATGPLAVKMGDRDLPILGRVKAGVAGFCIDNGDVTGMTERPPSLVGVSDAYAVEVWDDSMHPVLRPGYVLWVNPNRPAIQGDAVIVQTRDGQALVKEMIRQRDGYILLHQYNPHSEIKIALAGVVSVHLVVGNTRGR